MWTLDQMYQKVSGFLRAPKLLLKDSEGAYLDVQSFNDITTYLNTAKGMIAKRKFRPSYVENKTLDSTLLIDISSLGKTLTSVKDIKDSNGYDVEVSFISTSQLQFPQRVEGDVLTISYYYIPADFVELTDVLDFPPGFVDPIIPCYFGAYMYLKVKGQFDKADEWLNMWNDAFEEIVSFTGERKRIKDVYSW